MRGILFAVLLSILVSGCASFAEYRDPPPKTAQIVRNVTCELRDAIRQNASAKSWLLKQRKKGWVVKLTFDLSVDQRGEIATGDSTWVFPLNMGATFGLTAGAGVTGTGNRYESLAFDHALQQLDTDPHLASCPTEQQSRFAQLGGHIGIADLIARADLSRKETTVEDALSSLIYRIEFIVAKSANVAGRFNLIPIGTEKTFSAAPRWSGTRTDTQKLTMSFSLPDADKEEEICPVMVDEDWPAEARRKCPAPVYTVEVKVACQLLNASACKARPDCTAPPKGEGPVCIPACSVLGEKQCKARSGACSWDAGSLKCTNAGDGVLKYGLRPSREKNVYRYTPRAPAATSPSSSSSLTESDRAKLDNVQTRAILQDLQRVRDR